MKMINEVYKEAQKWSFKTKSYRPYLLPEKATLIEKVLNQTIECASCKTKILYGNAFTSRTIHNSMGLGYCVCSKCYEDDWENEREAWGK